MFSTIQSIEARLGNVSQIGLVGFFFDLAVSSIQLRLTRTHVAHPVYRKCPKPSGLQYF